MSNYSSQLNLYGLSGSEIKLNFTNLTGLMSNKVGFTVSVLPQGSAVPVFEQKYTKDTDPIFNYVYPQPNAYNLIFTTYADVTGSVRILST